MNKPLGSETRTLSVVLTEEELQRAMVDLSTTCRDEDNVEDEKKSVVKQYASRLEGIAAVRKLLVQKIQSRSEPRPVECEWRPDYKRGNKALLRLDTFEAVEVIPLTDRERQVGMDLE